MTENTAQKRLLVMAGGTGGHVFPAIAVAEKLQQQGWQICWLGTRDRMEATLVPKYGIPIEFIQISGLRGKALKIYWLRRLRLQERSGRRLKLLNVINPMLCLAWAVMFQDQAALRLNSAACRLCCTNKMQWRA